MAGGGPPACPGSSLSGMRGAVCALCRAGLLCAFHGHCCGRRRCALHVSSVISCARFPLRLCTFLSHGCGRHRQLGRQERGSGGKPGTGRLGALGGFRVPPSAFPDWSPLLPVHSQSRAVPDLALGSPARGGGEVGNMEAARSECVSAGRRGDRDGNAARSARTRGRCAARPVCGQCPGSVWYAGSAPPGETAPGGHHMGGLPGGLALMPCR
jgi:hypothetical protein